MEGFSMSDSEKNAKQVSRTLPSCDGRPLIGRRTFVAYASTVTLGLAAGPVLAEESRQVSLRDAHKGTLEIDLRIMNQYEVQPQAVQDFHAACRAALTGPNPEAALAKVCRVSNRWKLGARRSAT